MRIFKNKWFARFARKERISDVKLVQVVRDVEAGRIDVNYGGGVIKQRVARSGAGKSGGYRTIILYLKGSKAFFIFGFSKKDQHNINDEEVAYFKKLARVTLTMDDDDISALLDEGTFEELTNNG